MKHNRINLAPLNSLQVNRLGGGAGLGALTEILINRILTETVGGQL